MSTAPDALGPLSLIPRRKRLSREEEIALAERIQRGDLAARNELVEANIGLVGKEANKLFSEHYDDLVQAGIVGLIQAANGFDPVGHEAAFSTYAAYYIKLEMAKWLRGAHIVRVPIYALDANRLVKAVKTSKLAAITLCVEAARRSHRYFAVRGDDKDRAPSPAVEWDAGEDIDARERWDQLMSAMNLLSSVEQRVIAARFGLDGEPLSDLKLAKMIGISQGNVRHIRYLALRKLRAIVGQSDVA